MPVSAREVALAGVMCALGVVIPVLFHMVGLGRTFLPMHLPVLVAGLLLSPRVAWTVGVATPWISSFLTGMPPMPMPILMSLELLVLAEAASLLRAARVPAWAASMGAIALRCAATWALTTALAGYLGLPPGAAGWASVIAGLPGVALQLLIGQAVVAATARSGAAAPPPEQ